MADRIVTRQIGRSTWQGPESEAPEWPVVRPDQTDKIKEAITAHWGARCDEYVQGCPICDAWAEYDALVARPEQCFEVRKGYTLITLKEVGVTNVVCPLSEALTMRTVKDVRREAGAEAWHNGYCAGERGDDLDNNPYAAPDESEITEFVVSNYQPGPHVRISGEVSTTPQSDELRWAKFDAWAEGWTAGHGLRSLHDNPYLSAPDGDES